MDPGNKNGYIDQKKKLSSRLQITTMLIQTFGSTTFGDKIFLLGPIVLYY